MKQEVSEVSSGLTLGFHSYDWGSLGHGNAEHPTCSRAGHV